MSAFHIDLSACDNPDALVALVYARPTEGVTHVYAVVTRKGDPLCSASCDPHEPTDVAILCLRLASEIPGHVDVEFAQSWLLQNEMLIDAILSAPTDEYRAVLSSAVESALIEAWRIEQAFREDFAIPEAGQGEDGT